MKKIAILGDSITEGCGASNINLSFASLLKEKYEVLNYGVGGTRIARQVHYFEIMRWNWAFVDRVKIIDLNVDKVIVFGGTNDFGSGDAPTYGESEEDIYSFSGAIRYIIHYLKKRIDTNKILFILPLHRFIEEKEDKKFIDYINILETILQDEGVEYLDLYHHGLPRPTSSSSSEYFLDGLHPNDKGHLFIKQRLIEYLEK
ncbi:MAG: SGNH/GDSL hydrolase family protein [Bacilli bacterium]